MIPNIFHVEVCGFQQADDACGQHQVLVGIGGVRVQLTLRLGIGRPTTGGLRDLDEPHSVFMCRRDPVAAVRG